MIVSLTGLIGSGKDTVADHLIKEHGFVQLSFAESVKDALAVIFGWDREMLEGKTKEHREARNRVDGWWANQLGIPHFTPRWAMTTFGTDVMRKHFDDRIWMLSVKDKITRLQQKNPKVKIVISDARYVNELIMLSELNSLSFEITRGPLPSWWTSAIVYNKCDDWLERKICQLYYKHISKAPNIFNQNVHSSEYDWIGYKFDHTLYNNSTIDSLKENVDLFLTIRKTYERASDEAVIALLAASEKMNQVK